MENIGRIYGCIAAAWSAMKPPAKSVLCLFLLLAACSGERPVELKGTAAGMQKNAPSETTITSSPTNKPIYTPTRTLIPSVTPFPTATPDLELLDSVFLKYYDNYAVIGRLRNNTSTALYLGGEETGLEMTLESWTTDSGFDGDYLHITHGPVLVKNDRYDYPHSPDVLFPGETGILASPLSCYKQADCRTVYEQTWDPPDRLGFAYQYQTRLNPYTGTASQNLLHPKPENIKFSIRDDMIFFHFELAQYSDEDDSPNIILLLLDAEGAILDSAAGDVWFPEDATGVNAMIKTVSYIDPWGDALEPLVPITSEILKRLDHLEIFVELSGID